MRDNEEVLAKLREKGETPITAGMGDKLAKELKCAKYLECSAKNQKVNFLVMNGC